MKHAGAQIPADPGAQAVAPQVANHRQRQRQQHKTEHNTEETQHRPQRSLGGNQNVVHKIPLYILLPDGDRGNYQHKQGDAQQRCHVRPA